MIAFTSSSVCWTSSSPGRTPNRRTIAFESFVRAVVNGPLNARKAARNPARRRAVCSAMKPIPIEAIVIPTWQAERYSSIRSICPSACWAPRVPSSASASSRDLRERTSANSAATNRPLTSTSRSRKTRRRTFMAGAQRTRPGQGALCAWYFEEGGRRPLRTPERYQGAKRPSREGSHTPSGMDSGPHVLPGRLGPKPLRRPRKPVVVGAVHELGRRTLANRRDGERGIDPEAGGDHRGVHAEEALVVEDLAAIVDHPEACVIGHPAAAQGVRGVDARRLGEPQELADASVLRDPLHRLVGLLPHPDGLLGRLVAEHADPDRPGVGLDVSATLGRHAEEGAVARVLDHRQDLDVVGPGGDRALLLPPPPRGLAVGLSPVVVQEVGELREQDLLEGEAGAVVP